MALMAAVADDVRPYLRLCDKGQAMTPLKLIAVFPKRSKERIAAHRDGVSTASRKPLESDLSDSEARTSPKAKAELRP